jgi:superfamily I DNA/RNA helicase
MPLPEPIGRQKEVLYLPEAGHGVVLGTAGSGKTTLAILRAAYLARRTESAQKTMLVTFNKVLSGYLEILGEGELHSRVDVRNYHHFARGYLQARGKLPYNSILDDIPRQNLIEGLVVDARRRHPTSSFLRENPAAIAEELRWFAQMGIGSERELIAATSGNLGGLSVPPEDLPVLWNLNEEYHSARAQQGKTFDWHDIASAVRRELAIDESTRLYRHVVIDEGQDFSPEMLRSLAAAIPTDGSMTFFGDIAQQIYGSRISWRDAGLILRNDVWRFEENYRNTLQIAAFALGLARGPFFIGGPDMVVPNAPRAAGLLPAIVACSTVQAERRLVVDQAASLAQTRRVAVLLRDRRRADYYVTQLRQRGVAVHSLDRSMHIWPTSPGVWVGTYHSAKGLEFDAVLLPHVDGNTVPDPRRLSEIGDRLGNAEEAKLLYVAITRARAQLLMTYSGELSPLLAAIDTSLSVSSSA